VGVVISSSPSISEMTVDRWSVQDVSDAAQGADASTPPTPAQPSAAKADVTAPTSPGSTAPSARTVVASPPPHISEELQFVEAFAEPGAEDGAGAEVHVREPWNAYARMTANAVIARLVEASREEIAAVILYDTRHCSSTDKRDHPAAPPTRKRNARAGEVTSFSAK
jgi:hypothetical protein